MNSPNETLLVYGANLTASSLSLFGSIAIIINYFLYANKAQLLYKLILNLCIADFGGSLSICISQILLLTESDAYDIVLCKFFRAAINFFFVSSFCWTSSISLHIFVCSRQRAQIPQVWFHVFSWGIPAILTTVLITGDMIEIEPVSGWCHTTSVAQWTLWFAPLIVSFAWNLILYSFILARYRSSNTQTASLSYMNERQRRMQWKIKKRLSLYLLAFMLCWVWDLSDNVASHFVAEDKLYWLWLLQSFFSPLQGFLNFLVYGVSSRMFRPTNNGDSKKRLLVQ